MNNTFLLLFALWILCCACDTHSDTDNKRLVKEDFDCQLGSMQRAYNEHGADEKVPAIKGLGDKFIILVDSSQKVTNFISFGEALLRNESATLDTSDYFLHDEITVKQKLSYVAKEKVRYKQQVDSVHLKNNQNGQRVWVINNSSDTVLIQMQDWSFICILEAVTKGGKWLPIQYWRFSECGNSYYDKRFLPKTANSFIMDWPRQGDYATRLRFKLMGVKQFYYSNEFVGRINYCQFMEANQKGEWSNSGSHYKLDTLIHLSVF